MSGTFQKDQASHRTRSRAKKACRNCNARRVRCNVVESQPCNNCARADVPCEIMSSRRGKYDRSSKSLHRVSNPPKCPEDRAAEQPTRDIQYQSSVEDVAKDVVENRTSYAQTFMNMGHALPDNVSNTSQSVHHNSISPNASNTAHDTTESSTTPKSGLESTVFLGESNSITTFSNPNRLTTSDHRGLQYSIPGTVSANTVTTPLETQRRANKVETLTKEGAFSIPPRESCETLFRAYFAWFHPCFPIIERFEFYNSFMSKNISPLLLQAVLFVAASYCNGQTLKDIGLGDRYDTRSTFYNRAKDLYDADYETNKIAVSQALFLMSFWRAGPLLEKDTRHWLGAAISLAQTKGMHRSSSKTSFSNAKLRKRIWWSLYVRDRQCSASLGLPIRIRDEDCDIEMLEEVDFDDDDTTYHPGFLGSQTHEHVSYAIHMAKLARLLGKVVLREFAPGSVTSEELDHSKLRDELVTWEESLPPAMRSNATSESFWAAMLHLAYNNLYILLYRSAYVASLDGGQMALQAACKNTRILEDLLAQDLVQHGNVHLITSLFSSLCIHTLHLRRSTSSTVKKLAEYRAQLCLLGLRELQNTWDVTNWVLQLYFEFLDQSIAKRLQPTHSDDAPVMPRNGASINQQHPATVHDFEATQAGTPLSRSVEQAFGNPDWNTDRQTMQPRHLVDSLDFASHLFSSREAEDFSMFQLQPDLFAGDMFGGGLDHYYNSMVPRQGSSVDPELRQV